MWKFSRPVSKRIRTRKYLKMGKLKIFIKRLNKIGIDIKLVGNYPWLYLDTVNGKKVTEKFEANHGFTIAFSPIRPNQELNFTDISEIFKIIRKYKNQTNMKLTIDKNTDLHNLCNHVAEPIMENIFREINRILKKSKNENSLDVNVDININISKVKK